MEYEDHGLGFGPGASPGFTTYRLGLGLPVNVSETWLPHLYNGSSQSPQVPAAQGGARIEGLLGSWVSWPAPRARLWGERNLRVFPIQNDKSSTPGLKSNTPTPRNDAPTPGTSTTPGLRSMPGKPPGMDPIGIMGRHDEAGSTGFEGRGVPRGGAGARAPGSVLGVGALPGPPGGLRGQVRGGHGCRVRPHRRQGLLGGPLLDSARGRSF